MLEMLRTSRHVRTSVHHRTSRHCSATPSPPTLGCRSCSIYIHIYIFSLYIYAGLQVVLGEYKEKISFYFGQVTRFTDVRGKVMILTALTALTALTCAARRAAP